MCYAGGGLFHDDPDPVFTLLSRNLLPRRLGAWLALAFTLPTIVLSVLLVTVIERRNTEQVKSNIGHSLAELALQTSDKLERGMYERYREVHLMAQCRGLRPETPLTRRRETLNQLQDSYGYYSWIGVAGMDGKVQVAAKGLLEGADVAKRPWFGSALKGIHAGDVHEAVLLAKFLPQQQEPWRFVDVAFPVRDDAGRAEGVLGVRLSWQWARDVERSVIAPIAARRQVEALIVDAKGVVLLGPAGLQGKTLTLASLKSAQMQKEADAQGLVGVACASLERLVRLIGDVLDIQRMEAGQMDYRFEAQQVAPVVKGAVAAMDSFASQAGVRFAVEVEAGAQGLRAEIDRDRITQVLTNLPSNAIKFSEPCSEVLTRLERDGAMLRIAVIDHGAGIPEAFRERIFQRFAQADSPDSRRKGGTGLGLNICKTIAEEHGGRIRFESVEGEGTSFFVELPALTMA